MANRFLFCGHSSCEDAIFIQGLRAPNECHLSQGPSHYGSASFDARVTRCWSLRGRRVSPSAYPRLGSRAWINSGYLSAVLLGVLLGPPTPGQPVTRQYVSAGLDSTNLH